MFSKARMTAIAGSLALAACNTPYKDIGSPDPGFGEVAKHNAAVQIIDPDPVYRAEGSQPGDQGEKGAQASRRYRTDQVKQIEQATTTSSGSSAGSR
jgi:hypothetical protein